MSAARDAILGRIRAALGDAPAEAPVPRSFRRAGTADRAALIAGFAEKASAYRVRVELCGAAEVAATAARLLGERGHVRLAVPAGLPAGFAPEGFDLVPDEGLDRATLSAVDGVITACACAIAQTGTIVLDHGAGQGRRALTLLPDYHLCIVEAGRIVDLVPEAVARMEPAVKAGRPLTFISGPSATSDIELSRVEGVHGPRTLDVIVVRDA
ncbi:LutC/YkgG family protein [Lichenibacterium dinghuense]|uniref:LutC/YkgG family protein n=1 Tax=Lichenibacterium dinghuense TaxID=2895977 RepID=UPI001F186CEB|nr:LUD domain-containing protein [Lichenibacterium sp. 6Y81]